MDRILMDRENRYNTILELIEKYNLPVVCGKLNYPGIEKNTKHSELAFDVLLSLLNSEYRTFSIHSKMLKGFDGSSVIFVVDMEPKVAKEIAMSIENGHELGRLFDIDIYTKGGESLGREKLNLSSRKCLICNEDARICMRLNRHDIEEIINAANTLIESFGEKNGN
ncbi:citrate lyase holo-[acyl-carrier protein] synthase [Fervidicella metallireducens]|nr:citrate lyase holo-[acyl-carrier protein] synthase [Fervidicella metallireducens]